MPPPVPSDYDQVLYEKLRHSELFATYQDAFRAATGLPLRLVGPNLESWCMDEESKNRSSFCEVLNLCNAACHECIETNRLLMQEAVVKGPSTCHCFAGMAATAVPVRCGRMLVGFLKTGQVFNQVPTQEGFSRVAKTLSRQGIDKDQLGLLKELYMDTRSVEPQRYQGMITLLSSFALQLGQQAEKLVVVQEGSEPAGIAKARAFIQENLSEPLPLSLMAQKAGLSESHFCRVFRDATGLTLTDYINRCRIEWAKKELLKPERRISEIAFHVGYQSLSQFNRSFSRVTGRSPSRYREEELTTLAS
ncbi:MAG: helix-turn-helix domain-containing protein [Luteolibacter sp.]